MKFHIWTVGCQMNVADSRKLAAGLERAGFSPAGAIDEADLVVLNTCSVREHAEERAIGMLGRLKKMRSRGKDVRIAVMGCMVGPRDDELRRRFPYVDAFARPQDFAPILELAGVEDTGGEFWPTTFAQPDAVTAYVPVIHGCDKFCTYCIVPYRRGREKSRTIDDIRNEVEHYCARGVREVTLLGQTVEAYGHDLSEHTAKGNEQKVFGTAHGGPDLGDLMRAIHDVPGLERIRFLTSYPKDMTERIVDAVAELPKVCEHFNIPVQSGDPAVLERMRRGYTLDEYLEKFGLVRSRIPDAAMVTDIIVGFCGETDAEFQNTYDLLARLRFDKVHVAAYSPRPGTIAHRRMADDVPPEVKQERLRAVEQLEARISFEINSGLLDTVQEVLVETRKDGRWTGRNRQGKLIHFEGEAAVGRLVDVRIEKATAWSLQGTALPAPVPA
ncbi:MAG TPA: tRNA (N6-isopentenyl adenosine(37)-C2)-methylthiotransferase MiaB [Dehalococcoidia bacterium]|nr:tRNA (N6-isopentenyl adenosine(37)-C2)-methylthiotransferase MiaB [Dehalococcoidia bacterium]